MQNLNRPNFLQRIRAAFQPPGLMMPAQKQSERMPDLERWTMPHRSVDMTDWQNARNMATNVLHPDRARLMDLYDSILVDSHLASVMETRVLRVMRSRFRLVKDGEAQPELLHHLEAPWFEDFLRYVAEAVFRGHTLIELGDLARPGELRTVNRIDPRNVLPWSGIVVRRQGEETGYNYREAPLNAYLIEVGRPDDLGLLCDVGPVAIIKKYAVGSWSDYVHKYGIPPRWVRTNSRDARRFKQLETMMQQMLSSAYGVIEGDEEIQIMQTPGTDAHKVFDELISRMNSEISKRLLGQDGTTDNKDASGTYGSLRVLQSVAEDRHAADKASVGYVINQELMPRLTALGYPFAGVRFEWDGLRDLAPMELVDAVSKLGMVMDIDPEYIEERTGIRILGARRMPGEIGGNGPGWPGGGGGNPPGSGRQGGGTGGAGGRREEEDDDDEDGDGVTALWGGEVHTCGICGGGGLVEAAAVPLLDDDAINDALKAAFAGKRWSQAYFDAVKQVLHKARVQNWDAATLSLSYGAPEYMVTAAMDMNLFWFSGLKTMAAMSDLNQMAKKGGTWADFKRRVDESGLIDTYGRSQLRAEYTNVAMSSIQAGRYYDMQRNAEIMPFGQYVTIGDTRVRKAHEALNDRVWRLDHPIWREIWPPNGWNCRCTVLPVDSGPDKAMADKQAKKVKGDLLRSGEWKRMEQGGFDGNRAVSGEIFRLNRAFRDKLGKLNAEVFKFDPESSYGRKDMDYTSVMERQHPHWLPAPKDQAGLKAWMKAQQGEEDTAVIVDHQGLPWTLDWTTVKKHTTGDYATKGRDRYLHLVPEAMGAPDEVWQVGFGKGTTQLFYIRYYDDLPLVVRAVVNPAPGAASNGLRITSWYEGVPRTDERGVTELPARSGLLSKKMPTPND